MPVYADSVELVAYVTSLGNHTRCCLFVHSTQHPLVRGHLMADHSII
ncbi:hypothetical protein HUK38_12210 [Thiospirillum jenense]|uniref:Uncharacterized protein n=1 Tax=Thiospirillum jenense TaxID=1653858 RepID=A0A839HG18_9GAMM|nr:hypothetical protein [Thiospirillum jenense]